MERTTRILRTGSPHRDMAHIADLRELELLRQVLRRDLRLHSGQRTLAREIGIDRTVLRKFVSGQSVPESHALHRIREWAQDRPELAIPISQVGLAMLAHDLPPADRPMARKRLAAAFAACFREAGMPVWVTDELAGGPELPPLGSTTQAEVKLARIREILDRGEPEDTGIPPE
jgi:hypothetical protein